MTSPTLDLSWSRSFLVVDADQTVAAVLHQVYRSGEDYAVVAREDGRSLYAYRHKEIVTALHDADPKARLWVALGLHEHDASSPVQSEESIPSDHAPGGPAPRYRVVKIDKDGRPESIGEPATMRAAAAMQNGPEPRSGRDRRTRSGSQANRGLRSRSGRKIPKGGKAKKASKVKSSRKKGGN